MHVPRINSVYAGKLWQGPHSSKSTSQVPIICTHGIQDNCGSFDSLIPLIIKDNSKIFALDLPGHGFSSHTKELGYHSFLDGLTSIRRILNHFQWEKVTLLGHSLGAIISYIFSASFPEQVHRYIALDNLRPIPRNDPTHSFQNVVNRQFIVEQKLESKAQRPLYTFDEILAKVIKDRKQTVTEEGCRILLRRGAEKVNGSERYRFTQDIKLSIPVAFRFVSDEQSENLGRRIKCPVCVIKGEPGEDYEPREKFMRAVDIVSKSAERLEFHLVNGTHHFHLNEPNLIAPIINKFIDS